MRRSPVQPDLLPLFIVPPPPPPRVLYLFSRCSAPSCHVCKQGPVRHLHAQSSVFPPRRAASVCPPGRHTSVAFYLSIYSVSFVF